MSLTDVSLTDIDRDLGFDLDGARLGGERETTATARDALRAVADQGAYWGVALAFAALAWVGLRPATMVVVPVSYALVAIAVAGLGVKQVRDEMAKARQRRRFESAGND